MAHVHIREVARLADDRGTVSLIYHIPIDNPVANIIPTPLSNIDNELDQTEKDALAAGSVVELTQDIVALKTQSQNAIVTAVKANWQAEKAAYNEQYDFKYKYFGATIVNAAT